MAFDLISNIKELCMDANSASIHKKMLQSVDNQSAPQKLSLEGAQIYQGHFQKMTELVGPEFCYPVYILASLTLLPGQSIKKSGKQLIILCKNCENKVILAADKEFLTLNKTEQCALVLKHTTSIKNNFMDSSIIKMEDCEVRRYSFISTLCGEFYTRRAYNKEAEFMMNSAKPVIKESRRVSSNLFQQSEYSPVSQ